MAKTHAKCKGEVRLDDIVKVRKKMGKKGEGNGSGRKDKGKEEQAADRDTGQVEFDSPFFCSFDHSIIFEYENENMQQEMATALQTLQMDI